MPNHDAYTVGWICALPIEYVAAQEFLDEEHEGLDFMEQNDNNIYTLGRIGKHNVVVASLPLGQYGLVSAANVARDMVRSFANIRVGLMVGIGGGVPSQNHDIRLGDVVVSAAGLSNGGVFQYDYGKTVQNKEFVTTGFLNQPPQLMLSAVGNLKAIYKRKGNQLEDSVTKLLHNNPRLQDDYQRPDSSTDKLYVSSFTHAGGDNACCSATVEDDESTIILRKVRGVYEDNPAIHYGLIASANQLMKDAVVRDRLAAEKNVLCFEMEAAGLMNHFPCLVVRGICDYSDTHKNKLWQGYAAMTAAAYAKDFLNTIVPSKIEAERKLSEVLSDVQEDVKQTRTGVERIEKDSHSKDLLDWLSPPDPSTNLNTAHKCRHEESGQWFLQHPTYTAWKSERNSFLWLYGIPGCGKTILSSTIVEDLQIRCSGNHLYFFFDFTDNNKQYLDSAIRSLISQLYYQRKDLREDLDSLHSSYGDGRQQPSTESLCKTFQNMVQRVGDVWIVLDDLDECSIRNRYRAELLQWIRSLRGLKMDIHLLVTSRAEQDIKATIESCSRIQDVIPIRSSLIEEDIRAYIHKSVREHEELKRWQSRPDVQIEIEAALIGKAHGMFRWVSCQLDALRNCLDYPSLQKALASLPTTLDETYARIMANVPQEQQDHMIRICYEPIPRYLGMRDASWVSLFVSSTRRDQIKVKSVRKRGLESSPY